jgi:glucose/arabinose dehydrogenase
MVWKSPNLSQAQTLHILTVQNEQAFVCWRDNMRRKITSETWEQVRTAVASGIGLREIARNMNIPEGTVLARAKREGWTREIQNAKALAKREESSLAVTPVEAVAATLAERGQRHLKRMAGVSEKAVDHIEAMDGVEILDSVDQIEKLDKVARRTFGLNDAEALGHQAIVNIAILDL